MEPLPPPLAISSAVILLVGLYGAYVRAKTNQASYDKDSAMWFMMKQLRQLCSSAMVLVVVLTAISWAINYI